MNIVKAEELKKELLEAVKNKDSERIERLAAELNINEAQKEYFSKGLTGFPSVDRVWLKYYDKNASENANSAPDDITVWDLLESQMLKDKDITAIEYFGRKISRQSFIDRVYDWSKTFKAMGVQEDEIVSIYGLTLPDICAMALALNMIGAVAYFLKLAISPEALAEETKESKIAVVFDDMWENVSFEFEKEKFEKVIFVSVGDSIPSSKKSKMTVDSKSCADFCKSKGNKYFNVDSALDFGKNYGEVKKAKFVSNRNAFITSSSGTTVGGVVKGVVATNESVIYQLFMAAASGYPFCYGGRVLNNFPPTASTSLYLLFMLGIYKGLTVIMDPQVDDENFYNQIITNKPSAVIGTGSMWEAFFARIQNEIKSGKNFNFNYSKAWTVGGEGTTVKKLNLWNEIMEKCNASHLICGYGSSELASGMCADKIELNTNHCNKSVIASVGIPYAGLITGVFDKDGNELPYGNRGELWVKCGSAMKCYYNKPELTAQTLVDGWIHTGDMAEISKDGFIYIHGRCKDCIKSPGGEMVYLFDVANTVRSCNNIIEAIVLNIPALNDDSRLFAHIEWVKGISEDEKINSIKEVNEYLKQYSKFGISIEGFAEHEVLPCSPTTKKKDKNALSKQTTGYFNVVDNKIVPVSIV